MAAMTHVDAEIPLDVESCRRQFPGLARQVGGRPAVFFDGPAGSQVPQRVIDAVSGYLSTTHANHGGRFATSIESDALVAAAHRAVADFLGADDPDTVIFGANMTTLTFALSRAVARTWRPGDEVVVTRLDHDANVTAWELAARDAGAVVRRVAIRASDCTLDLDDFARQVSPRTRLVAVGAASNATGTVNPVAEIVEMAHAVGAEVFIDAVHYAPHRAIDVAAWNCDYLVCSAYKFFGPHVGILWGRREQLEQLPAYKVRPAPDELPGRWMTGTPNLEGIAGTKAAVEYLADLGRAGHDQRMSRRDEIVAAFARIAAHERLLCERLLRGLEKIPAFRVWGISDPARLDERVPTVSVTHRRLRPVGIAERLGHEGIFVWHGNHYAVELSEALGLEPHGTLRIGLLHYNTADEVDRLMDVLASME